MHLNKVKNFLSDAYNSIYLILNKNFLKKNYDIIEEKAKELIPNSHPQSNRILRKMQVKLIQNSKLVKEKDPKSKILKSFIKIQREIAINSLPQRILIPSHKNNNLKIEKEKLLKKYLESTDKEDANLKKFLTNPHVIDLAKKMDRDFHEKITVQEFANLISIQYEEDIEHIFFEEKIKSIGLDICSELNLALLLLQKNDLFIDAIDELVNCCNSEFKLACIQTIGMGYQNGIYLIQPNRY